jgi:hypothetical protein
MDLFHERILTVLNDGKPRFFTQLPHYSSGEKQGVRHGSDEITSGTHLPNANGQDDCRWNVFPQHGIVEGLAES